MSVDSIGTRVASDVDETLPIFGRLFLRAEGRRSCAIPIDLEPEHTFLVKT